MESDNYLANCISRIMSAHCDNKNVRARECDLAQAIFIAADQGTSAAHNFLVEICNQAEAGKYKTSDLEKP